MKISISDNLKILRHQQEHLELQRESLESFHADTFQDEIYSQGREYRHLASNGPLSREARDAYIRCRELNAVESYCYPHHQWLKVSADLQRLETRIAILEGLLESLEEILQ